MKIIIPVHNGRHFAWFNQKILLYLRPGWGEGKLGKLLRKEGKFVFSEFFLASTQEVEKIQTPPSKKIFLKVAPPPKKVFSTIIPEYFFSPPLPFIFRLQRILLVSKYLIKTFSILFTYEVKWNKNSCNCNSYSAVIIMEKWKNYSESLQDNWLKKFLTSRSQKKAPLRVELVTLYK